MDYFNQSERASQRRFAQQRDEALSGIIRLLASWHVHPNAITLLGVLFLVAACLIPKEHYLFVSLFLFLYVFMDGIDGGLARALKVDHKGGSLIDICADQMGVILIPTAAVFHLNADPISALLFSNGYIIFIVLAVFANTLNIKSNYFMRVKYLSYLVYVLDMVLGVGLISGFMALFSAYYWGLVLVFMKNIYVHYNEDAS